MDNPKVSIVVPVYNVEKYLSRCMDSLINQTFKEIEIIAVNDGSTDNSLKILNDYKEKDSRIKVIDKVNEGLSKTRNIGIDKATGEYIAFIDSDDWVSIEMIEKLYCISNKNKCDIVLCSYIREYNGKSLPKDANTVNLTIYNQEETKYNLYRKIVGPIGNEMKKPENLDSLVTVWGKLYKSSKIKDNNIRFIDTSIIGTEDLLFNVYAFNYVEKSAILNEGLYHYWRENIESLTYGYKPTLKDQWKKNQGYIKEYLDLNNFEDVFYEALNNRICMSTLGLGLNECSRLNELATMNKIGNLRNILNEVYIREAFNVLELKYFPIHWKTFYFFNKNRMAIASYFTLKSINILRRYI